MYAVSANFLAAVRGSHLATARVEVWSGEVRLATLNVNGGSVSVDSTRDVRRTLSGVTLSDPTGSLTPATATDLLAPLGNELRVWRGVQYSNGLTEDVPQGVFGFDEVTISEDRSGVIIQLDGYDRSRQVSLARWSDPFQVTSGTDLGVAIQAALQSRAPGLPDLNAQVSVTVGANALYDASADSDPWKDLCALASAHGCELFFDSSGVPVLRSMPIASSSLLAAVYEDGADAVLLTASRKLTTTETYNGVIVTGEGVTGPPVRAEAWDTDPSSPTSIYGKFGKRPKFYSSPLIATYGQALTTAQAMLSRSLGVNETVSWTQVVNPAHDVWDLVRVTRASLDVSTDMLIDSLTIPLLPTDSMTATGRGRVLWG